ncbi:DUF7573 domain-containing protein [Halopenitus persicus]|uniref:DUF7573 domain-containing protein n=1 Tax=Halopenitus persicus TaxID=1048396 RepID=A0A1H3E0B7_9EURY|nr:hypothetical protein [Halopenitus persicus]QHS16444.1 hypothetical protein GWK26_04340 [haloarchaeon 3A1-DGR]SDX72060.1 hypothetical protein SAMN05216564_101228 [Halopenitus persicus]
MTEDRSLDEFADAGSDRDRNESVDESAADGETDVPEETDTDETDAEEDANPVEPATATATWTSGGAACDRCDAVVERRWLEDGAQLCADCKEW